MKSTKNNRSVIVGIFILLGLVILVVAVFTLGGQKKTFVKGFAVNAVFDDVNGLQTGSNVWLSGVKIGTVKKISFYTNSRVLVSMNLEKAVEPNVHKDAKAKIGSDGLIGNKIIVIYGGTPASHAVASGDYLAVEKALSTDDMLATLQANNKNLLAITGSFKNISNKIDSGSGTLGYLLNNETLAKRMGGAIDGLQATVANFEVASRSSKAVLANLQQFSAGLNTRGSLANELTTDTTMFTILKGTITQLRDVVTTASQLTDNLKAATDRLHETNNVPGVLLNDPEAAAALQKTIQNLQSSSSSLNEDLKAAQSNFLLRGYFKKKAKNKVDSLQR